jgi:hypothetical protein
MAEKTSLNFMLSFSSFQEFFKGNTSNSVSSIFLKNTIHGRALGAMPKKSAIS